MSFFPPVNITVILSFIIFVFFLFGVHNLLTSFQENECELTFMFQYPQFVEISLPHDVKEAFPKYNLYGYGEGSITENVRKMKFKGIPVLFIPGSSGSYKQGRSLASVSLRKSLNSRTPFHFNYFMVDFNEEQVAIFGGVLEDQTKFTVHCIKKILSLYKNNEDSKKPSIILIGHSFGGIISKRVFAEPNFDSQSVNLIISLSTPHKYPLFQPDYYITSYYEDLKNFWKNNSDLEHITVISIGGGPKDIIVRSDVIVDYDADINVLTTAVPSVWLTNDHLSIMWCKQLMLTIIRAMFDSVDVTTKQLSNEKEYVKQVFNYHLLKRNAGKKYSGSLTSRFASFERSSNWFESLQRQFSVSEPKGVNEVHYVMIRLFSDPKSEAAFIEAYNINVRDWIFVCSADVVYNSIRICETGENISNLTEIAPADSRLRLRRKFVYVNLHELKAKGFSHVIIRLPPSKSHMTVNIDVHQPSQRNLLHQVPKMYSLSENVILNSENNVGYYSIRLMNFEYIWQSFILKVKTLSCKTAKNHAVVSFITPWSNEDQHYAFRGDILKINLNLISPKPGNYNGSLYPLIRFNLDPTCTYQATIQSSLIGMFAQSTRYYCLMLPAFLTTVAILTLRQQMIHLADGKCVLFHSALSAAVRRYYIILQPIILGPKFLGLSVFLTLLPMPDFLILQGLNLDSFFSIILLYAVAIVVIYILGAVIYLSIVLTGQAAHKMALRFVAKALSGIFNWSEWVLTFLHQVPFFVSVLLISISLSTSGAVALWLGTFFYFLKLCKMYEDYLDDWFNYSIKLVAQKVKSAIINKQPSSDHGLNKNKSKNEGGGDTHQDSKELGCKAEDLNVEENKPEEIGLLPAIHFHITVFSVWLLLALLYVPSLLMWAKNYNYSISLEKDPSAIPGILASACGSILWQNNVPNQYRKMKKITSTSLFTLSVLSAVYASISFYRLGFMLSASLLVVTLNQILSKYI